jgi:hypothetical protein
MRLEGKDIPEDLIHMKEMKLTQVLEHKNEYFKVDDQFEEEVTAYVEKTKNKGGCCRKQTNTHMSPHSRHDSHSHSGTPKMSSHYEIPIPDAPFKTTTPSKIIPTVSTTEKMKNIPASLKIAEISSASKVPK